MTKSEELFDLLEGGNFGLFRKAADSTPIIRVACDRRGDFLLHRARAIARTAKRTEGLNGRHEAILSELD